MVAERGPQGDHGQTGDTGLTGATGLTGRTGLRGASFSKTQVLVVFLFVVFAFVVLSLRTESQSRQLREIVQNEKIKAHQECVERNLNVDRLNRISDRIIAAEKTNPFIDDRLRQTRIDIYKDTKLTRVDCGVNPSPTPKS